MCETYGIKVWLKITNTGGQLWILFICSILIRSFTRKLVNNHAKAKASDEDKIEHLLWKAENFNAQKFTTFSDKTVNTKFNDVDKEKVREIADSQGEVGWKTKFTKM